MTVESLTPISDADLLTAVKNSLNISGTQFDTTLQLYIDEVKAYLKSAGVKYSAECNVLGSTLAVGCISRGVADLWNYGNGDTKLSEYFYQRADQLRNVDCVCYTEAKLIIYATDSLTGADITVDKVTVSGATVSNDGNYYFPVSEIEWAAIIQATGYTTVRINFVATEELVKTGEIVLNAQMEARE